jgi:hypothetical protein
MYVVSGGRNLFSVIKLARFCKSSLPKLRFPASCLSKIRQRIFHETGNWNGHATWLEHVGRSGTARHYLPISRFPERFSR